MLRELKRYDAAIVMANQILEMKALRMKDPATKNLGSLHQKHIPDPQAELALEVWKAKARELLTLCEAEAAVASGSKASAKKTTPMAAVLASSSGLDTNRQAVHVPIGRCSWKQIGLLHDNENLVCQELQVIPRLQWVLAWVRGDLLLWDYNKEEIVHWITLGPDDGSHLSHIVDMPELNSVLYFRGQAQVYNLQALQPRGGRTSAKDAFRSFLGTAITQFSSIPVTAARQDDLQAMDYMIENMHDIFQATCIATSKVSIKIGSAFEDCGRLDLHTCTYNSRRRYPLLFNNNTLFLSS